MDREPALPPVSRPAVWTMAAMALGAMALSGYLLSRSWMAGHVAGCGPGSGCDAVLSSRWSMWMGVVPVSLPALAAYVMALVAVGMFRSRRATMRQRGGRWLALLAVMFVLSAAWFTFLQLAVLGAWCPYCMTAHGAGVAFALAVLFQRGLPRREAWHAAGLGLLLWLALPLGQWLVVPAQYTATRMTPLAGAEGEAGEAMGKTVRLLGGHVLLRAAELPVLGSPEAPRLAAMLMDYTCPNCRVMHRDLLEALEQLPGGRASMGVVILPMPLEHTCHPAMVETDPVHVGGCEYARLALALWKARPEAFEGFDRWLMEGELPPGVEAARAEAVRRVGEEAMTRALADGWVGEQLGRNIRLWNLTKAGRVPVLMTETLVLTGRPASSAAVLKLLTDPAGAKSEPWDAGP